MMGEIRTISYVRQFIRSDVRGCYHIAMCINDNDGTYLGQFGGI